MKTIPSLGEGIVRVKRYAHAVSRFVKMADDILISNYIIIS
jgi:hypothetical protein